MPLSVSQLLQLSKLGIVSIFRDHGWNSNQDGYYLAISWLFLAIFFWLFLGYFLAICLDISWVYFCYSLAISWLFFCCYFYFFWLFLFFWLFFGYFLAIFVYYIWLFYFTISGLFLGYFLANFGLFIGYFLAISYLFLVIRWLCLVFFGYVWLFLDISC